MKRILIVEPHRILREALVTALNRQSGFEVGAQSGSVAEAGRAVALGDTDVALINPALPTVMGWRVSAS